MHGIYMDAGILGGSDSAGASISECTYSTHGTYMDPRSYFFPGWSDASVSVKICDSFFVFDILNIFCGVSGLHFHRCITVWLCMASAFSILYLRCTSSQLG